MASGHNQQKLPRKASSGTALRHKRGFPVQSTCSFLLWFFLLAAPVARADVTLRYKTEVKAGAAVPVALVQQFAQNQKLPIPTNIIIQIKGDKGYSNAAMFSSLIDFTKQEITVLDAHDKLFATVSTKDYWGEVQAGMPAMPPMPAGMQKFKDAIKTSYTSEKSGLTDTVLGVQVEETVLTLSVDMTVPDDFPLLPGMFQPGQPVHLIKLVMHLWNAAPGEVDRVQALKEFAAYKSASAALLNPTSGLQQALSKLPGTGPNFTAMLEDLSSGKSLALRMHSELYAPVLSQIVPLLQAQGHQLPADFDPNAPLVEMNTAATELSSAAIDDSVFVVPSDYHATPLPDLLKVLIPTPKLPVASPQATP